MSENQGELLTLAYETLKHIMKDDTVPAASKVAAAGLVIRAETYKAQLAQSQADRTGKKAIAAAQATVAGKGSHWDDDLDASKYVS